MSNKFPTFEEAKRIVIENGIKTQEQYSSSIKDLGLPAHPERCYKDKGWTGWYDFIGKKKPSFPEYEEAKRLVKENGINGIKEYRLFSKDLGLPTNPHQYYKDKGWTDWDDFFGKEKADYPEYEEAKRLVKENGINSCKEYKLFSKDLGLPYAPDLYYKDKGWTNWYDFLGKEKADYPEYEEAKKVVKEKGINSNIEYSHFSKDLGLPAHPERCYKDKGWTDWFTFLGKEKADYPEYEEAKRIVKENGFKDNKEYKSFCKDHGLPSAPDLYYKDKGWTNWYDFLGKTKKNTTSEERTIKVLETLSATPILLKEDAPVQIIYLLASQVDNKLARGIEELLESTDYEDRVKWLKEQLKSLKSDSTPKPESSEENPADKSAAMDSIFDAFEDTWDDLPEDVESNIKTILDNYFHNAVNRALIEEYDD